jgi:hypothetical protein
VVPTISRAKLADLAGMAKLDEARNVTSFLKLLPNVLADFQQRTTASGVTNAGIRLTAVAWDARQQKARAFLISTMLDGLEEIASPGTVIEVTSHWSSLRSPAELLGRDVDCSSRSSFDPTEDGRKIMQTMREEPFAAAMPGSLAEGRCAVGGEAEQAVVSKTGVELYCLHEWPDQVGSAIGPNYQKEAA